MMMAMEKLSVTIITFNEQRNIERCIRSVSQIASEIIVLDSGSSDETVPIAERLGAKVTYHPFDGHIEQKNRALEMASMPWILSLDADEEVSDELKDSIVRFLDNPEGSVASMNRLTNYCGRWIRHGGWYPDAKIRLVKRGSASWGGQNPHDKLIPCSQRIPYKLKGDLLHYSIPDLQSHLRQIEKFSSIAANQLAMKKSSVGLLKIIFSPISRFIKIYFIRLGFLEGFYGFTIAALSAWAVFLKYLKANWIRRNNTTN